MLEPRPVLPLWAALIVAVGAGAVLDLGFPSAGIWPCEFIGIAMLLVALIGRRAGTSLLVGYVAGLTFWLIDVPWLAGFVRDPTPWYAASGFESLYYAGGALLITFAYRWVPRIFPGSLGRLGFLPVVVAGLWVVREGIEGVFPYGGFAWGRVAYTQAEGPLSSLFPWLGVAGVSFVMVFFVAAAIEIVRGPFSGRRIAATTAVVAAATVAVVIPAYPIVEKGTMTVAAVQGNGKAAYYDHVAPPALLLSQFDATTPLIHKGARPDVVVWPEGASDLDPQVDETAASVFDFVTDELHTTLVSGTITERGNKVYNTSIVWHDGKVVDYYDKHHPVPFGEYVPQRAFFMKIAPQLIGLVGRDYTPGTTNAVAKIKGITVGLNICFDIVDDQLLRDTVTEGAQVIFAQSNNADFGHSDESLQQLQIARVRALELGRTVVVDSTVGQSAIIAPDGSTIDEIPRFTAAAMMDAVPLSTTLTPAALGGRSIELFVGGLAVAALIITRLASRSAQRRAARKKQHG